MKTKVAFILFISLITFSKLSAAIKIENKTSPNDTDTALVLKNAQVLDVKRGKFKKNRNIIIQEDKIVKISRRIKAKGPIKAIDVNNGYVIPGLIDSHVHVTANRKNRLENTFNHLNYFLQHGITTVRDAAGDGSELQKASLAIHHGEKFGANVYFAAFMAGDWYYNRGQNLRDEPYTPWEQLIKPGINLDSAMAAAKACGATGVKLYHSFDEVFLKDVISAAKKQGLKVWGHAMLYPARPVAVANAGMEVLSHVSMLESLSSDSLFYRRTTSKAYKDSVIANLNIDEFCKAMKANKAILDATLCVSADRDYWVFPLLKRVHAKGVKISSGTDQIVDLKREYPRLIDEMNYFVNECGFTPAEAIRSATLIGAEVVGQAKYIGSIEVGKRADLLILKGNPLLSINELKLIDQVIQNGRIISKEVK